MAKWLKSRQNFISHSTRDALKFCLMKVILLFALLFTFLSPVKPVFADETHYARILSNSVCFYSSPNETSALFYLPNSYFVELYANAGEEFYAAKYMDLVGYVKKAEVSPIYGVPIMPYADRLSFRVTSLSGLDMRSSPKSDSPFEIIDNVPYLARDIILYGQMTGDAMVPESTTTWYYCKYLKGTLSSTGYLYSLFCDKVISPSLNTEVFEFNNEILFPEKQENPQGAPSSLSFTSPTQIIIIIAISLPCVGLIYLLFKPTRIAKNEENSRTKKKKIHRLKKSDYYELDD